MFPSYDTCILPVTTHERATTHKDHTFYRAARRIVDRWGCMAKALRWKAKEKKIVTSIWRTYL